MSRYHTAEYYLPHASPMVLLERVLEVGEEHAQCAVTVSPDGVLAPFLDAQGALPGWYGIELMAQAIGVWSGWHGRQHAQPPQLGMLLGGAPSTANCRYFLPAANCGLACSNC